MEKKSQTILRFYDQSQKEKEQNNDVTTLANGKGQVI